MGESLRTMKTVVPVRNGPIMLYCAKRAGEAMNWNPTSAVFSSIDRTTSVQDKGRWTGVMVSSFSRATTISVSIPVRVPFKE